MYNCVLYIYKYQNLYIHGRNYNIYNYILVLYKCTFILYYIKNIIYGLLTNIKAIFYEILNVLVSKTNFCDISWAQWRCDIWQFWSFEGQGNGYSFFGPFHKNSSCKLSNCNFQIFFQIFFCSRFVFVLIEHSTI